MLLGWKNEWISVWVKNALPTFLILNLIFLYPLCSQGCSILSSPLSLPFMVWLKACVFYLPGLIQPSPRWGLVRAWPVAQQASCCQGNIYQCVSLQLGCNIWHWGKKISVWGNRTHWRGYQVCYYSSWCLKSWTLSGTRVWIKHMWGRKRLTKEITLPCFKCPDWVLYSNPLLMASSFFKVDSPQKGESIEK